MDLIRDSQLGHAIRVITQNKVLLWPEELPNFQYPIIEAPTSEDSDVLQPSDEINRGTGPDQDIELQKIRESDGSENAHQAPIEYVASRVGISGAEAEANLARVGTNAADVILVDWYTEDDVENPRNWTSRKKLFTTLLIWYAAAQLIHRV